ncbi:glucosaminidase domain-containing protein [Alphaproteobacteria bacterium]|nr:glucosaminidase domain-containing protein [Alphaproteobacteria bacterium]
MAEKFEQLKVTNYLDNFFTLIVFLLLLSGFLGPGFWKIKSLHLNLIVDQKSLSKNIININKLEKLHLNKNYLSSDQINEKDKVLSWSNQISKNAESQIPLPRMYFPHIPKNMDEYEVSEKKKVFLSILLPIALRGNELVLEERRLMKVAFLTNNIYKIEYFAKRYNVKNYKKLNFGNLTSLELNIIKKELLIKVNKIPISMIIAQAIIESGWGSSRFAKEGNALFGEWTWQNNVGIKPKGNLDANFAVKSFENLLQSLNSYILNLNRHTAYKKMRVFRALTFKTGKKFNGYDTAFYLENYAEIGLDYVTKVTEMINSNKLYRFENSALENYYN